jgi:hypothetical protein
MTPFSYFLLLFTAPCCHIKRLADSIVATLELVGCALVSLSIELLAVELGGWKLEGKGNPCPLSFDSGKSPQSTNSHVDK